MAFDHSGCDHPQTKAGRAGCRRAAGTEGGATPPTRTRQPRAPRPRPVETPAPAPAATPEPAPVEEEPRRGRFGFGRRG